MARSKTVQIRVSTRRKTLEFDYRNLEAARAIVADPSRYGGPTAFPCMWSRLFLARRCKEGPSWDDGGQAQMFGDAA